MAVPRPAVSVAKAARHLGLRPPLTQTVLRPVAARARLTASTVAVAPSYTDALATGRPANLETSVWYSKRACRTP